MSMHHNKPGAKKRPGDKRTERERALAVCARMTDELVGMQQACQLEGLDNGSFMRQVRKDDELRIEYEVARECCIEGRISALNGKAVEVMKFARTKGHKASAYVSAFVSLSNITRWEAERLMGKKYGNRVDVNHSGAIDLAGRLAKARERSAEE